MDTLVLFIGYLAATWWFWLLGAVCWGLAATCFSSAGRHAEELDPRRPPLDGKPFRILTRATTAIAVISGFLFIAGCAGIWINAVAEGLSAIMYAPSFTH